MKKFLPLLITPFIISALIVKDVNAATEYDNVIQTTTELKLEAGISCSQDITTSWFTMLSSYATANGGTAQTMVDHINNNDTGWAVTLMNHPTYTDYTEVHIYQWNDSNTPLTFSTRDGYPALYSIGQVNRASISCNEQNPQGHVYTPPSTVSGYPIAQSNNEGGQWGSLLNRQLPLFINHPITYPEGYQGVQPPDSTGGDDERPSKSPELNYTVASKDVASTDKKQDMPTYTPDEGYYFKGYSIIYYLFKCESGWDDQTKLCHDGNIVNTQNIPSGEQYKYSVLDYGDYKLEAEYVAQECYRYPSYPATPDNCYLLQLNSTFPDVRFHSTSVYLKIDGKTYNGDTAGLECDVSGYCEEKDDGLGMFRTLDGINTFGLQQFFTAPINFYATLATKVDECTPITVPFMNTSFQLTCMKQNYYNWSPTIMLLFTTIITATTGYLIALNIFRTIKNINTPDHDGIEVAKL